MRKPQLLPHKRPDPIRLHYRPSPPTPATPSVPKSEIRNPKSRRALFTPLPPGRYPSATNPQITWFAIGPDAFPPLPASSATTAIAYFGRASAAGPAMHTHHAWSVYTLSS